MHQQGAQNPHGSSHGRQLPSPTPTGPPNNGQPQPAPPPSQQQQHLHHPRLVPVENYPYNNPPHHQLHMHPYNHPHRLPPPQVLNRRPSSLSTARFEIAPSPTNNRYPTEALPHIQTTARGPESHPRSSQSQQITQQQAPPPLVSSQPLPPPIEAPSVRLLQQQQQQQQQNLSRIQHSSNPISTKPEPMSAQTPRGIVHKKKIVMGPPSNEHSNPSLHSAPQQRPNIMTQPPSHSQPQQHGSMVRHQQTQPQLSPVPSQQTQHHQISPPQQTLPRQIRPHHESHQMDHQRAILSSHPPPNLPPRPMMITPPNPSGMMNTLPSIQRSQIPTVPPHSSQHVQGVANLGRGVGQVVSSTQQQLGVTMEHHTQSLYRNQMGASGLGGHHRGPHSTSSVVSGLSRDNPVGQTIMSQPQLRSLPSDNFGKPMQHVEMDTRHSRYPNKSSQEPLPLLTPGVPSQTVEESASEVPDGYDMNRRSTTTSIAPADARRTMQSHEKSQHLSTHKQMVYEPGESATMRVHDVKLRPMHQSVENRIPSQSAGSLRQSAPVEDHRPRMDNNEDRLHQRDVKPQNASPMNTTYYGEKGVLSHHTDDVRSVRTVQQGQYPPDSQDQNRMAVQAQRNHQTIRTDVHMSDIHGTSKEHAGSSTKIGNRDNSPGKVDQTSTGWRGLPQPGQTGRQFVEGTDSHGLSGWKVQQNQEVKSRVQPDNTTAVHTETQNNVRDSSAKSREVSSPQPGNGKLQLSVQPAETLQQPRDVQNEGSVHANSPNSNQHGRGYPNPVIVDTTLQRDITTQGGGESAVNRVVATDIAQLNSKVQQSGQAPTNGPSQLTHATQTAPTQESLGGERSVQGSGTRDTHETMENNVSNQRRELKVEDALAYLEEVKNQFSDQPQVYNQFLDIMKDFKAQTIDTVEVIKRVSELFVGHKNLILGFNTFLPAGYEISVTEDKDTGALNTGFRSPNGFNELPSYRNSKANGSRPTNKKKTSVSSPKRKELKKPVAGSGKNVPSLSTLPASSAKEENVMASEIQPEMGDKFYGVDAQGSNADPSAKTHVIQEEHRVTSGEAAQAINPDWKPAENPSTQIEQFEEVISFVKSFEDRFSDTPDIYEKFVTAIRLFREEPKSIREFFEAVAELIGPHKDLLLRLKEFVSAISSNAVNDTRPIRRGGSQVTQRRISETRVTSSSTPVRRPNHANGVGKRRGKTREMQFFDNLKSQLGTFHAPLFQEFIKCLSLFVTEIVCREELLHLTSSLFQDIPDVQASFVKYLDSISGDSDDNAGEENQDTFSSSAEGAATTVDVAQISKYKSKPMSEIASELGIDQMHSYRRMPPDFPQLKYSGRSLHEKRTLNDTWINVTMGSEDYAFNFMRKNQNEENLFRCEDDRYELDLVIETNASTIMKLETIWATICKLPLAERKRHAVARGVLSPIHLSNIQRIYGDDGREVLTHIRMNPSVAVPVVLRRLKEKDLAWRKARMDMNRVWREIGERNFHRSLDHRSGYFKQVDRKDLSTKSLLCDILDPASSVLAREAEMTRARSYSIPAGAGGPNDRSQANKAVYLASKLATEMVPRSLELEFMDKRIHRIVYQLLRNCFISENGQDSHNRAVLQSFKELIEYFFEVDLDVHDEHKTSNKRQSKWSELVRNDFEQAYDAINEENAHLILESNNATSVHGRNSGNGNLVLFGDENIYILWRLYHIFFERVMTGLNLAREQVADRERRENLNRAGHMGIQRKSHLPELETKPHHLTKQFNGCETDTGFSLGPETGTADEIFDEFVEMLKLFVRGKMDCTKYEDKCRTMLGTHSYSLFTMDKAFSKLSKQILSVFSAEGISKEMINMFERGRELLKDSRASNGELTNRGIEGILGVCASRKLQEGRGAGAYLFRIQKLAYDNVRCICALEVIGQTGDEEIVESQLNEDKAMSDLMGCELHLPEGKSVEERVLEKREREKEEESESKTRKRMRTRHGFLLGRMTKNYPRRLERLKMEEKYQIVTHTDLRWKANKSRYLCFQENGLEVFTILNRDKRWGKTISTDERKEANDSHPWTEKMRKRLKLGMYASEEKTEEKTGNDESNAKAEEDVHMEDLEKKTEPVNKNVQDESKMNTEESDIGEKNAAGDENVSSEKEQMKD